MPSACAPLSQSELERPGRDDLVLLHHRAAHAVALRIALLKALVAAVAPGGAGVEREDGGAREHEASAQRAEHRIARSPVRRARPRRHRLDLVAVVLQRRAVAAHAQHAFEAPFAFLVADAGLARDRRGPAARVAVLALPAPASRPGEAAVVLPRTFSPPPRPCRAPSTG